MDLLCEPDFPAAPPRQTPYVCQEEWDGGVFRTYPIRKGRIRSVPPPLRQLLDVDVPDEPYLEILYPTPKEELQPFLQTWLFFGLLAELLGLNEIAPGLRLIDQTAAARDISQLHEKHSVRGDDSNRLLTGLPALETGLLIQERLRIAPDTKERQIYIRDCLHFANRMILSLSDLDDSIRYSICALGELFSTGIYTSVARSTPKIDVPVIGFSWHQHYMKPGGRMETQMLQGGWCPSEIEKIRLQFQGLHTIHYIGELKRTDASQNHDACSPHLCTAFQLDIDSYRPSHVASHCDCAHISVDDTDASSILRFTDSYPVVRLQGTSNDIEDVELVVEPYERGLPYVAVSHVWANGLGNPVENSLPGCQGRRVAQLIASLQDQLETPRQQYSTPYRFWIDTLCCPVEIEDKMIALERIADVYKNASHVLVLDASLTELHSGNTHPAELLLRVFGSSPWMRRLWTLQEGALTKSLYIQFADKAVSSLTLLTQLFAIAIEDSRYMRIWHDVVNVSNELRCFISNMNESTTSPFTPSPPLINLQRALHFRTVSVPSDEALCISTLMSLDTKHIAAVPDAERRMVRVWELLARSFGSLPGRLIFYMDESLTVPGWRWAPRTLLGSSIKDPVLGVDERVMRFAENESQQGIPTSLGLKVMLPGCRLVPIPRTPGIPLHPWPGVINPTEDQVILRHETTGQWFRIIDWYRSRKLSVWTMEERQAFDRDANEPLCREVDTGKCALIFDQRLEYDGSCACCMVQIEEVEYPSLQETAIDPSGFRGALKARRTRTVIMSPLGKEQARMMATIQDLANKVALDERTANLVAISNHSSQLWEDSLSKVRDLIKEVMRDAWRSQPELEQTVKNNIGFDLEEFVWVLVPKLFSHDIMLRELPKQQVWFVD